jgi:hypothetical protein
MWDKPSDRPTIPQAVEALRADYKLPKRGLGGCVYIIIENTNYDQASADAMAACARRWGDQWGDGFLSQDQEVADMLAAMTATQRRKLSEDYSFYPSAGDDDA